MSNLLQLNKIELLADSMLFQGNITYKSFMLLSRYSRNSQCPTSDSEKPMKTTLDSEIPTGKVGLSLPTPS